MTFTQEVIKILFINPSFTLFCGNNFQIYDTWVFTKYKMSRLNIKYLRNLENSKIYDKVFL